MKNENVEMKNGDVIQVNEYNYRQIIEEYIGVRFFGLH